VDNGLDFSEARLDKVIGEVLAERSDESKHCNNGECGACQLIKSLHQTTVGMKALSLLAMEPTIGMVVLLLAGIRMGQESVTPPGPVN
jgi:hypothetical protein